MSCVGGVFGDAELTRDLCVELAKRARVDVV